MADNQKQSRKDQMVKACMICKEVFKDDEYCPNCDAVLKKKAG